MFKKKGMNMSWLLQHIQNESSLNKKFNCHIQPKINDALLIQPFINPSIKITPQKLKRKLQSYTFGDHLTTKLKANIRIVSQNINCIRVSIQNNYKI